MKRRNAQEGFVAFALPCIALCRRAGCAWPLLCLILLGTLAGCGGHTPRRTAHYHPSRYYPPPGSASDPWGPYIHEASGRFGVPEQWIRRVMHQESGGQQDVISWAGAIGLMQVMPDTYSGLRGRYNLGDDPFDPHNNILAGTAYLREMYDRYGAPGFLAAYNAGPNRLDRYLSSGTPLPQETVNYVASLAPQLGPGTPMSGPLAVYGGGGMMLASRRSSRGCDSDAAYNPDGPCLTVQPAVQTVAVASAAPVMVAASSTRIAFPSGTPVGCDPDAAYDPARPCQPLPDPAHGDATADAAPAGSGYAPAPVFTQAAFSPQPYGQSTDCDPDAAYDPTRRCRVAPVIATALPPPTPAPAFTSAQARPSSGHNRPLQESQTVSWSPAAAPPRGGFGNFPPVPPMPAHGAPDDWAIQVGAFANLSSAQAAAETARMAAPDLLRMAKIELPATSPFGTQIAFRARLSGLTHATAAGACARLNSNGRACMMVPPSRSG